MNQKITAEEVLDYLGSYLQLSLTEIDELPNGGKDGFFTGQYYAFVECLEIIILFWDKACQYGLDFEAEKRYRLE